MSTAAGSSPRSSRSYWSAARTKFRQEERAAHHLENLGFKFYLPRVRTLRRSGVERRELMFPGFIFYRVREGWKRLSSTRGISRLFLTGVDADARPTRVHEREIDALREREDEDGFVTLQPLFESGDRVRVTDGGGSLAGLEGTVQLASARERCRVLVEMLGQKVAFELDARALEPA